MVPPDFFSFLFHFQLDILTGVAYYIGMTVNGLVNGGDAMAKISFMTAAEYANAIGTAMAGEGEAVGFMRPDFETRIGITTGGLWIPLMSRGFRVTNGVLWHGNRDADMSGRNGDYGKAVINAGWVGRWTAK